ncbi:MAG: hypothetical protein IPO26_07495 [Saprospiraceae bacterium]|nr:hypothetical protein [Saprospiraceae bacterium]
MAKVKVTKESPTGRNEKFEISRADFVKQIENGGHPGYHKNNKSVKHSVQTQIKVMMII